MFFCGDHLKNFCEDLFFFLRALALVSLVLGLGLEHFCPWPRECLSSERLSLALALDFFCVLGLGLGFFLCPWPWPRALCPRLHLCSLLVLNSSFTTSNNSITLKTPTVKKFSFSKVSGISIPNAGTLP